ncbi:MAG TPA: hypothetical protein VGD33_00190 [Chitinophagaceae bacterium]
MRKSLFCKTLTLWMVMSTLCLRGITQSFPDSITVIPGPQYKAGSWKSTLFGKHYRNVWTTPLRAKVATIDTLAGGLTPILKGGGRQTRTLRLKDKTGKEYVLRSVDKTFGGALPDIMLGTFVEDLVNDQVSTGHPYAAITIPPMINNTGIYHTLPRIYYIPKHPALDSFNKDFGDELYLFEERPDDDQSNTPNFGFSENVISTEKLLESLFSDNKHRVDQEAYIRARLFDMFIGDWGRHEDQWRWASFKSGDTITYKPIPRDRDQTYTLFDGFLIGLGVSIADLRHLQSFDYTIKDIEGYHFPARNLDRQLANEPSLSTWVRIAKELQQQLTDTIIAQGIRQLPPELFPLTGNEMIAKLKSRRDDLVRFATTYYNFLAEEVDVVGTPGNEHFQVTQQDRQTILRVYRTNAGTRETLPYYLRSFNKNETNELRIYSMGGSDTWEITSNNSNPIKIRIIGGAGKDDFIVNGDRNNKIIFYDNEPSGTNLFKEKLSKDSSVHEFNYDGFTYDKSGIKKIVSYNQDDRIHFGLGYYARNYQWRKKPFGFEHLLAAKYSISQGGFNIMYEGRINQAIGKWDLILNAGFDAVRWHNYFGTGNETELIRYDIDYYRLRHRQFDAGLGLARNIDSVHWFGLGAFFYGVKPITDKERFVYEHRNGMSDDIYENKNFFGAQFSYGLQSLDDMVVPRKGIDFVASISHTQNLYRSDSAFTRYKGDLNLFIPIARPLVLSVKLGGSHITGDPEIYQLSSIGGARNMRGHYRDRFQGKSSFYNANELQFLFNTRTWLYNGTTGIIGLYDVGRVWQPGEDSRTWHNAVGGGILIAPFNKIAMTVTYSISKEDKQFHLRLGKKL